MARGTLLCHLMKRAMFKWGEVVQAERGWDDMLDLA